MMVDQLALYPVRGPERDRWIVDRRDARNNVDASLPYAFLVEEERSHTGEVVPVATVFLTNRECPWHCVMCDLWRNTLLDSVPPGAIPKQISYALSRLPPARQIKLYNSGSFFDPKAIPVTDYEQIASLSDPFERVIVESHPSLVGERCLRLRDLLRGRLEVALGLETAHPVALERLNKRLTVEQFQRAAERLKREAIDLRVFLLVSPPFIRKEEALFWVERSLDVSFASGATAVALIPTRAGNGAVDALAAVGDFEAPDLETVEAAFCYGLRLNCGRVFVDLWDIEMVSCCPGCRTSRLERLRAMNLSQAILPAVPCTVCGGSA